MPIKFTKEEIEIMAELEHARWNSEKYMDGWSFGNPRDDDKKIHPYLVEWERLPKKIKDNDRDIKDYDRDAVREIPSLLAEAGFEIYRLK